MPRLKSLALAASAFCAALSVSVTMPVVAQVQNTTADVPLRSDFENFAEWWSVYMGILGWTCDAGLGSRVIQGLIPENLVADQDGHRYIVNNTSPVDVVVTVRSCLSCQEGLPTTLGRTTFLVPAKSSRAAEFSFSVPESTTMVSDKGLKVMDVGAIIELQFDGSSGSKPVVIKRRHVGDPRNPAGFDPDFTEFDKEIRCVNDEFRSKFYCTKVDEGGSGGNPGPH